jgi:hypothetical protein
VEKRWLPAQRILGRRRAKKTRENRGFFLDLKPLKRGIYTQNA